MMRTQGMGLFDGFNKASGDAKRLDEARKRHQANPTNIVMANALVDALVAAGQRSAALDVVSKTGAALSKAGRGQEAMTVYGRVSQIDPRGELMETFIVQHRLKELREEVARAAESVAAAPPPPRRDSGVLRLQKRESGTFRVDPAGELDVRAAAGRLPILRDLPEALLAKLLPSLTPLQAQAGVPVFLEGSEGGSLFFVVSGELALRGHDDLGGEIALATLAAGDLVGEISFLTGASHPGSLLPTRRSELLELPRAAGAPVIDAAPRQQADLQRLARERTVLIALARSRLFRSLSPEERGQLASRCFLRAARSGSRVMTEGDPDTTFFLLIKGEALVTKLQAGREVTLGTIRPHTCFGDISALHGTNRTRSVTAVTPVEYLGLSRDDLAHLLERSPKVREELDAVQMERFVEEARILTG